MTCCCFSLLLFSLFLFSKTCKKGIPNVIFLCDSEMLCISNISWKQYLSLVVKHPGEMSLKFLRSVCCAFCQKMKTPKLYVILMKIITKEMTYTEIAIKSISLFNEYYRLKSPPPVHSSFFTSYLIPMFSILGLKFKL